MRIQDQLVGSRVVEDRHFLGADDDQSLLLKRMKPTHEDMGANAVGESELARA